MKSRIGSVARAGFIAFSATIALAQAGAKAAPDKPSGLKVGSPAPRFSLKDQAGRIRTLDDLLKEGKVALVFYRSAEW